VDDSGSEDDLISKKKGNKVKGGVKQDKKASMEAARNAKKSKAAQASASEGEEEVETK